MNTNKRAVLLEFRTDEILHDVCTIAYNEGEAVKSQPTDGGGDVIASLMQDVAGDSNLDRVIRVLDLCHAECVELLYPYTKLDVERTTWQDNELKGNKVYALDMLMPDTMSGTTVSLLSKYVHECMVASVLSDWMSVNSPKTAEKWAAVAADMKDKIKNSTLYRTKRVRRGMHPF